MALRDRLLGPPERAGHHQLGRILRRGSPSLRIRAARAIATSADPGPLADLLQDPVPGVRRAAARGVGWRGARADLQATLDALAAERTDTVRAALAAAAVRCGADLDDIEQRVHSAAERRLGTWYGPRCPGRVTGSGGAEATAAMWLELGRHSAGAPRTRDELLARWRQVADDPHAADARRDLARIATHAGDELRGWLDDHWSALGRYGEHAFIEALGWHGDPRHTSRLVALLRAMDTDPGRAFHHRHLAATALGRLGDPSTSGELLAALEREALEFEGRPGAGLGIQFPVRNTLLWALGEVGDPAAAPVLTRYLENTSGSATGGFHLPAMAALVKLGEPAVHHVEPMLAGSEVLAANAAGVLGGIGGAAGARARRDPRPRVRTAAEGASAERADTPLLRTLGYLRRQSWKRAAEEVAALDPADAPTRAFAGATRCAALLARGDTDAARQSLAQAGPLPSWWRGVALADWLSALSARLDSGGSIPQPRVEPDLGRAADSTIDLA